VVDIYSGDYKRSNTMFKFTYQAFVLLSLVWAYASARILAIGLKSHHWLGLLRLAGIRRLRLHHQRQDRPAMLIGLILIALMLIPAWYPLTATSQWLGDFSIERYQGLDGLLPLAAKDSLQIDTQSPGELAADYAAINWLNRNVTGQPVVLEASGESYTDFCRISAFTGLPTIIGWETHEWLWRTSKSTPDAYIKVVVPRQEAVREIFTTTDQKQRQDLIKKFQVAYIIIGDLERQRYSEKLADGSRHILVQDDLLREMGTVVFQNQNLLILKIRE